jgi:hypothetical protein
VAPSGGESSWESAGSEGSGRGGFAGKVITDVSRSDESLCRDSRWDGQSRDSRWPRLGFGRFSATPGDWKGRHWVWCLAGKVGGRPGSAAPWIDLRRAATLLSERFSEGASGLHCDRWVGRAKILLVRIAFDHFLLDDAFLASIKRSGGYRAVSPVTEVRTSRSGSPGLKVASSGRIGLTRDFWFGSDSLGLRVPPADRTGPSGVA